MKKNYKKVYGYGLIMVVCVILIVLVACLSETRLDTYQEEYESRITGHQKQVEILEKQIVELTEKNRELEEKLQKTAALESELETGNQALNDLIDIFDQYKDGDKTAAKDKFSKIEPIGFDDTALAYYRLLKDFLNK